MLEPPAGLTDDVVRDTLAQHYGIAASAITFLPLGHDASAWVYQATAEDGRALFAKLRLSVSNQAALLVPRHLHEQGAARVVAPLPTAAGALWAPAGDFALILYPFVEGESGMARGMTAEQWRAYGAALRQIHAAPVTPALAGLLRRDDFAPAGADMLRRLDALLGEGEQADPLAAELAGHWRARRQIILGLLDRAEGLGRRLAAAPPPLVLCHADIHTGNVLVDTAGEVWVVDWDETMLAPRERDLMFAIGGISARLVGPQQEGWFREGYGDVALDATALAFYRAAWAVSDLAAFGAEVCLRPDLGPASREQALRLLVGLFAPGEIVDIALGTPLPA